MKRNLCLSWFIVFLFVCVPVRPVTASAAVTLSEVDTIGVMPQDYIGTLTIEGVNTVEKGFPSENAFPSQGVALLSNGDVVVCDTGYGRLHVLSADLVHKRTIGSLGSGRGQLQYPADVATDSAGHIYVADFFSDKVVKYASSGSVLLEFGTEGAGAGQFEGAAGIAVTADGNIWVADQLNNRIEEFSAAGKYLASIRGISHPAGMTSRGSVPYAVAEGGAVYKISNAKAVRLFAASGEGENLITSAADLAVGANGRIYVADRGTGNLPVPAVKVFSTSGQYQRSYGQYPGNMQNVQDSELLSPGGVAVASDGTVYVMNSGYFRDVKNPFGSGFHAKLVKYASTGGVMAVQESDIDACGRLNNPQDIAVDTRGQLWVVCSVPAVSSDGKSVQWNRGYVDVLDHSGNYLFTVTDAGSRVMLAVESVSAGKDGLVYVSAQDTAGSFIAVFDEQGAYVRTITAGTVDALSDLETASDGTLWVCDQGDQGNGTVVHLTTTGKELNRFKTAGMPGGLSICSNGDLLVCVWGDASDVQQVIRYSPSGVIMRTFGTSGGGRSAGKLYYPYDAVQLSDGLILVSDAENGRFSAFRQDGSVAWTTQRSWYIPGGMAWSPSGTLYVADPLHNVIRELSYGSSSASQGASFTARFDKVYATSAAGKSVSFRLGVRNRSARSDVFSLHAQVPAGGGWTASATPASLSVAAGQTGAVAVTVHVPAGLAADVTETVNVTVGSKLDPAAPATVHADVAVVQASTAVVGGDQMTAAAGATFTVPISIHGADDLYGAGCQISYDTRALQLVRVDRGSLLGKDALFIESHATAGKIQLGATLKDNAAPVSGSGDIALVTFKALGTGATELDIGNVQLYGGSGGAATLPDKAYVIPVLIATRAQQTVLLLQIGSPTMNVNGVSAALDAPPIILQNRTLVPARAVVEALGGTAVWDASARTVSVKLGSTEIVMIVGKSKATVNGTAVPIDPSNTRVAAQIINGRLMLPIQFVAVNLGANVGWNGETRTVTITRAVP